MKFLEFFRTASEITPIRLNDLVAELRRLQNIRAAEGDDLLVLQTSAGVIISRKHRLLTIDDRYTLDCINNQSDRIKRLCDYKEGELDDFLRVRAVPYSMGDKEHPYHQAILLLDDSWHLGKTSANKKGGWLTTSALTGLAKTKKYDAHEIASPIMAVGQMGDVLILPIIGEEIDDTEDGDTYSFTDIRHDGKFYKTSLIHGRIRFRDLCVSSGPEATVTQAPEGAGMWYFGHIVFDPQKANLETALLHETAQARVIFAIPFLTMCPHPPTYGPPPVPADPTYWGTANPKMPPFVLDPFALPAFDYGNGVVGKWERAEICGMRGSMQIPQVPIVNNVKQWLRFYFEYQAEGDGISDKVAQIVLWYRTYAEGADMAAPPLGTNKIFISCIVPQNAVGTQLLSAYGAINGDDLADNCRVIIDVLVRDVSLVGDTFGDSIYVSAQKVIWGEPA